MKPRSIQRKLIFLALISAGARRGASTYTVSKTTCRLAPISSDSLEFSAPSVEINLGGQALERWPRELFVSEDLATVALEHFLDYGELNRRFAGLAPESFRVKPFGKAVKNERLGSATVVDDESDVNHGLRQMARTLAFQARLFATA